MSDLAATTPRQKGTWREGTKGKLSGRFARVRVWPASDWAAGGCVGAEPFWLLIEEQTGGKIKDAVSNLPARTRRIKAVRLWKSRWLMEQGYPQMKQELGLDHFESRSWRGFHHHVCLVMLAYGFLALEQDRARRDPSRPGKKGGAEHRCSRCRRFVAPCSVCWLRSVGTMAPIVEGSRKHLRRS
ncbi:MAG: hypothetical protein ABI353_14440 [Isosphaeraceae bacterium]